MMLWCLGNTTVRSPFRLRDGLAALSRSPLQGNLRGKEQEVAFRHLLGENGIVKLGDDVTYSVGRKWRSALNKLGFLYPQATKSTGVKQSEIGAIDMITPNGLRLILAETVPAMQECFLRALAAHYIPSPLERNFSVAPFSPLRHTLSVMLEMERQTGESRLEFAEMAAVVQLTSSENSLADIVFNVLELRKRRLAAPNKRAFDRQIGKSTAALHKYAAGTFNDYADTNFRYLKATGLVKTKGHGISLSEEKRVFIQELIHDASPPSSDRAYLATLCNGATLPTDNMESALNVLNDLVLQLDRRGIPFELAGKPVAKPADITIIRHQIEAVLSKKNEEEYAQRQKEAWEEITGYMELLATRRYKKTLSNGDAIEVPQSEAPAYLEWTLWRAFLAINRLINKPYEARRFKIDQDFLPVGTAQGNGPDLIFEFEDFVIAVEATLTENSRQEAVEGEPVRRHVADLAEHYENSLHKPVYGLFIANRIDSNTAETFRIGVWYNRTDEKMRLTIIPLTLAQFKAVFAALFKFSHVDVGQIRELLELCGDLRTAHEAPAWKQKIAETIQLRLQQLETANGRVRNDND